MVAALGLVPAFALSHYQIGYNDGCAGRTVLGSHTADYERGYTHGQEACHNSDASQDTSTVVPSLLLYMGSLCNECYG